MLSRRDFVTVASAVSLADSASPQRTRRPNFIIFLADDLGCHDLGCLGATDLKTGLDHDGNVQATSDFRGVYASLLEQWLGVDAASVIPDAAGFQRPVLVN